MVENLDDQIGNFNFLAVAEHTKSPSGCLCVSAVNEIVPIISPTERFAFSLSMYINGEYDYSVSHSMYAISMYV